MTVPTTTAATEPTIRIAGLAETPLDLEAEGSDGSVSDSRLAVASDENVALKPVLSTDESARNSMYIVPEVAVRVPGKDVPLSLPSSDPCGPPS